MLSKPKAAFIGALSNQASRKSPAEAVKRSRKSRWRSKSERSNSIAYPAGLDQFGNCGKWAALNYIRWRLEHGGAQDIGNCIQARLIITQTICVPLREFCDLLFRLAATDL